MRAAHARLARGLVLAVLLGAGFGALFGRADSATGEEEPAARGWSYRVRFSPDLSSARVAITFRGFTPRRLVLARLDCLGAVRVAPLAGGAPGFRSNPARDGILPRIPTDGTAWTYTVDLRELARRTRNERQTQFVGRDLLTRAGLFLLHPAKWDASDQVVVQLDLPPGMHAAVGWLRDILKSNQAAGTVYALPAHAMALHARVAFGRFTKKRVQVPGGDLVYATLDAPHRATDAGIGRWLTVGMGAVAQLFGKPPVSRTHLILQPHVPGRGRPIVYGRATLSGAPMIHVMLSGTTTDAEMPGEWITIHEMLHLGMPTTTLVDRWFGEGFVSYYQEVVRARAGILTPQQAWQNLHSWMERGRASGGKATLSEESARMNNRYAYHRVYWGGAALALKMDARIRQATDGRRSLDDAMRHFHDRFITPGMPIPALELMRHADAFLGVDFCERMARDALGSRSFPDLRQVYANFGLRVARGRVTLVRGAPQAHHRDAIMRPGGR